MDDLGLLGVEPNFAMTNAKQRHRQASLGDELTHGELLKGKEQQARPGGTARGGELGNQYCEGKWAEAAFAFFFFAFAPQNRGLGSAFFTLTLGPWDFTTLSLPYSTENRCAQPITFPDLLSTPREIAKLSIIKSEFEVATTRVQAPLPPPTRSILTVLVPL